MKKYYIGIDIGGTYAKVGLLTKAFDIIGKATLPTTSYKSPQRLISAVSGAVRSLLKSRNIPKTAIYGVGVGVAGLVDAEKGVIKNLINIPGYRGLNIKRAFEKEFGLPVYADNDANAMALAEFHKGAGRGGTNVVCVTLGTGVGGGIVIGGRLYRGSTSSAGELGHIPINMKGPRCNCGGTACIETYAGNSYIARRLKGALKRRMGRLGMAAKALAADVAPRLLYKAAKNGDRSALELWEEIGAEIGVMLAGVINLLDPDKVVIGGGIADAGRFLFSPIKKTVRSRAMESKRRIKIVKARLGKDAGLVGAAMLARLERTKWL